MNKKLGKNLFAAAMLLTLAVPQPVQAAELAVKGTEYLPKEAGEALRANVEDIPEYVWEAYLASGGTITVTLEPIADWADQTVDGLYSVTTKDIRLHYDKNQKDDEIGENLLHEMGHFVYYTTLSGWDEEIAEQFEDEKDSLLAESQGYLTDAEAFASLYSLNYSGGPLCGHYGEFLKAVEEMLPQSGTGASSRRHVAGTGHSYTCRTGENN